MTYKYLLSMCVIALLPMAASAASWTQVEEGSLQSIRAITSTQNALMAAGNSGYTMHSTDGGETWIVPEKSASVWWYDAVTKDQTISMVGASGAYVTSEDDGQTWQSQSLGTSSDLQDIELDENYGYIVGNSGTVFYFANNNWNTLGTGVSRDLSAVHNMGDGTAWVSSSQGFLYYISSGGVSWTEMGQVASSDLNDVYFTSTSTGWIVGDTGTFKYTNDSGVSWTTVSVEGLLYQDLYAIEAQENEIVIAGDEVILYSNDGGNTWELDDFSQEGQTFFKLHSDVNDTFWIVGTQDDVSSIVYRLAKQGPEAPAAVGYYDTYGDGLNDAVFYWLEAEDDDSTELTYYVILDNDDPINVGSELEYTWQDVTEEDHTFEVYAVDAYGNVGASRIMEFTFEAEGEEETTEEEQQASPGSLIKTTCEEAAGVNDPCKAVYFYGDDGKRHAFPNEQVYFTWFTDFDSVIEVSGEFMSSLPLGTNVTYRPGTTLVKFLSVPTVYAVSNPAILRPIASEDIAEEVFGPTWNQNVDDISDAFLGNYTFGEEIDEAGDYSMDEETSAIEVLSDIF